MVEEIAKFRDVLINCCFGRTCNFYVRVRRTIIHLHVK